MLFFVIIFSLLFTLLAYKSLEKAVQLLIFALPAYLIRFQIGFLPSTLLEVMIWIVFVAWFIANFSELRANWRELLKSRKGESSKIKIEYPFSREIILLLVVSFVAVGVAGFSNSALGIWKAYFFEPILLYIVVLNVFGSAVIPAQAGILRVRLEEEKNQGSRLRGNDKKENDFNLPKLLWPLCLSAIAVALLAICQKITGNLIDNPFWAAEGTRRAVSFFGYPNAVGLYLAPLSMVFIGWFLYLAKEKKQHVISYELWVIFLAILSSFLAIIFAKSAGAMLGVAAGLAIFCLLASSPRGSSGEAGKRARIAVIGLIVLAAIGCAAVPSVRHSVADKILLRDFSGTVRRIGWNDSWKMISDGRLIFGAGLANFQATVKPYHQEGFFVSDGTPDFYQRLATDAALRARTWQPLEIYLYPHNIFLNFWSELGLAGMLLFIWIIGKFFFIGFTNYKLQIIPPQRDPAEAVANYKYLIIGLISSMVTIVIHGLVDVPYFKNDLAVMFWLLVAMLGLINYNQTKNIL